MPARRLPRDAVPASDGEEYFAMALLFAAHRWGTGRGIYDYESEANAILDTMLHKEEMNGGTVAGVTNMFDRTQRQIVFVPVGPMAGFTDPSYHLPAFYELWGRWARGWRGRRIRRPASRPTIASMTAARARSAAMAISASTPSAPR
jgi:oligosaccharide reducing-end xylanase